MAKIWDFEKFWDLAKILKKFWAPASHPPCSKVQAGFLRECVIPPGRVAAERTLALACQAYMRVRIESVAERWGQAGPGETARGRFWCREALAAGTPRLQTPLWNFVPWETSLSVHVKVNASLRWNREWIILARLSYSDNCGDSGSNTCAFIKSKAINAMHVNLRVERSTLRGEGGEENKSHGSGRFFGCCVSE